MIGQDDKKSETKADWERSLLEKLAFASLNEQKKARRWSIFFKLFMVVYLVILLVVASGDGLSDKPSTSGEYSALVDMTGIIMPGSEASADMVVDGLRSAFDSKAKGIILRANSPGGSPVQAKYIYDEIKRLRKKHTDKKIYAVIGDVCASGCYYAVAGVDKIYASTSSIVGSIGVLMDGFGFVDAMKKLGVERRLMTAGKNKGLMDPFSPRKAGDEKHVQGLLDNIHAQFIDVVREGRGKSLKETPEMFSGLFWTGEQAMAMGLVDEIGSAGHVAREVIGADEIVDFTRKENLLERFAGRFGAAIGNSLSTALFKNSFMFK